MLYRICKRLIERGQTAGLAEKKLMFFYALGRITEAEYKRADRAAGPAGDHPWRLMPTLGPGRLIAINNTF